jgi:hypothetical protein
MTTYQISQSVNRSAAFLEATKPQFVEFQIWKLETDLEKIYLNGHWLNVKKLNFMDWLEWRLMEDTQQSNIENTIDIDFVYAEFEVIN